MSLWKECRGAFNKRRLWRCGVLWRLKGACGVCGVVVYKRKGLLVNRVMSKELRETCYMCKKRILDEDSVVCLDCETVFCNGCLPDNLPCPVCYCVVADIVV